MSEANIAIDVYCVVLCLVIGVYVWVVDDRRDRAVQCFAGICAGNALMTAGDISAWAYTPPITSEFDLGLMWVGSFLFYASAVPVFMLFTGYITSILQRHGVRQPRYYNFMAILFAVYGAGCIASFFNGMFFSIDPEAGYVRGPWFALSQAVPLALHARNIVLIVRHRDVLSRRERWGFFSYIALPVLAEAIQMTNFGIALLNPAISITLLLIFLNIQSEHRALLAQREQELAEARADVMLSQIQPHFLYNTLTAIRELCLTDPPEAARTVTDFSRYLRENMASLSSRSPIPFEREWRHVCTYLALEQKRFGPRLRADADIRATAFCLPPLSLQVLVENAVRHGVTKREEGGCVRISTAEEPDAFVVSVDDDGVGFDVSAAAGGERLHVGLANTRSRVEALCGGTLEVESTPGEGTRAVLRIPKDEDAAAAAGAGAVAGAAGTVGDMPAGRKGVSA